MSTWRLFVLLFLLAAVGCGESFREEQEAVPAFGKQVDGAQKNISPKAAFLTKDIGEHHGMPGDSGSNTSSALARGNEFLEIRGPLLTTRFSSFEAFREVVQVQYFDGAVISGSTFHHVIPDKPMVRLMHKCFGRKVTSLLTTGVSEADFIRAREGGIVDKISLILKSPYAILNRKDLQRAFLLSRRRPQYYGEGDPAFYDLAETMMHNICEEDLAQIDAKDLSEKGYINTFNHVTSQAFMTTLFSERLADFIADAHERRHMPELINGKFTGEQLLDINNGPVDNYVDIINNEWGQELGKILAEKYGINSKTHWTPEFLTTYLNDIQSYYSWAFQVGFRPYKADDEVVIKFAYKLNRLKEEVLIENR